MDHEHMGDDLAKVLLTEEQIQTRLSELAADIWRDYEGKEFLLVGVLKGAVVVMFSMIWRQPTPVLYAQKLISPCWVA